MQPRDKETGAVTVSEVEVSAHDAGAANKGLESARHLGMFEADNEQAGKAAGEALARGCKTSSSHVGLPQLANGAKQAESETEGANVVH